MAAQVSTHTTLLNRLRADSDSQAWGDFVNRYGGVVRAVAMRHGLQSADADDVLQDVMVGLARAMPSFVYDPDRARFSTFLQSIVQRVVFRKFRQKPALSGIEGMDAPAREEADAIWESEWRQHHLRQAMKTIEVEFSAKDRRSFSEYVGSQKTAKETAELLGMSLDQVYQAKSRILKRLSELIAQQVEEEG